jgi:hypothetical protein
MFAGYRDAFHIVGISTLIGSVLMMSWIFYDISTQGYFIIGETNSIIRYTESGLVGFSVVYVFYLFAMFVKKTVTP